MASKEYLNMLDELPKRIPALIEELKELHINKSAGYAGDNPDVWANFRMAEELGISAIDGCLVRMSDKWIRIQNLRKNPSNDKVGESIDDTLRDLSAYALIAVCLMQETKTKKFIRKIRKALKI